MATKPKPANTVARPRKLPKPEYKSFRLSKRIKKPADKPLSKARIVLSTSIRHLWKYRKTFAGITGIYLLLSVLLVKGLNSSSDIPEIKDSVQELITGTTGQLASSLAVFGFLVGNTSGVTSEVAGTYQSILLILVSLALIWALRQTHADKKIGIRESFYRGMYPLVPFLVVLLVIGIQFIPLALSSWLFNVTIVSGLAVTPPEQVLWLVFCFLLAVLTIYMVSSSIFALYISTLPDMMPMKALRSARQLVRYRRAAILRKVLFIPFIILFFLIVIILPIIMFITPLAEWAFFALSMASLAVFHSYMYSLYRELL